MKKSLIIFASFLTALSVSAEFLSPEQAWHRAASSSSVRIPGRMSTSPECLMELTAEDHTQPSLYVFRPGSEGYMIVSADDCAIPLLGYSETGTFYADSLPANIRWWLQTYADEIAAARNDALQSMPATVRPQRDPIAPMISTRWGQASPYNSLCPKVGQTTTVTGCVATAMAQVMNYYKWPEKGTSSITYEWNNQYLTMNFATTTFDWNNMLNIYGSSSSATAKTAVARLMKACGYSVRMNYGTNESGAVSNNVGQALISYFNYDKGLWNACRSVYTNSDWEALIYNNLKTYGPIYYSGANTSVGHAFVCDGYSSDGYFHFNWGWEGMSDGYYLLSALNPASQGIGGSAYGYNSDQQALLGVRRPQSGSQLSAPQVVIDGTPTVEIHDNSLFFFGPFYNYSTYDLSGYFSLRFVNQTTSQTIIPTSSNNSNYSPGSGSYYAGCSLNNFTNGTYRIYPVFVKSDGTIVDIKFPPYYEGYAILTISGNNRTVNLPAKGQLTATTVNFESPFYIGNPFYVKTTFTNTAPVDYTRNVVPLLLRSRNISDIAAIGDEISVEIDASASAAIDYIGSWSNSTDALSAGNYYFLFATDGGYVIDGDTFDSSYKAISPIYAITLKEASAPSISVSMSINGNSSAVDPMNMAFNLTVKCTSGYMASPVTIGIFPATGGSSLALFDSDMLFVEAGETKSTVARYSMLDAEPQTDYLAAAFFNNSQVTTAIQFRTSSLSGIESTEVADWNLSQNSDAIVITAPQPLTAVHIFSTTGAEVLSGNKNVYDISMLPAGVYIVAANTTESSKTFKFIKQ